MSTTTSPLDVCSLKTAPLHTLILPRLANPVLDQAVYHKPCLLGPLYAVSPPFCSTLYIINLLHFFYPRAQPTQFQLSVCCPSVFSPFHCFPYSSPTPWRTIAKDTAAVSQQAGTLWTQESKAVPGPVGGNGASCESPGPAAPPALVLR